MIHPGHVAQVAGGVQVNEHPLAATLGGHRLGDTDQSGVFPAPPAVLATITRTEPVWDSAGDVRLPGRRNGLSTPPVGR